MRAQLNSHNLQQIHDQLVLRVEVGSDPNANRNWTTNPSAAFTRSALRSRKQGVLDLWRKVVARSRITLIRRLVVRVAVNSLRHKSVGLPPVKPVRTDG